VFDLQSASIFGSNAMASYVTLLTFTDEGVREIADTLKRAEAFTTLAKNQGVTVKEILWTQGKYDLITIIEGPDEATVSALLLSVARKGKIRGQRCAPSRRRKWRGFSPRLPKSNEMAASAISGGGHTGRNSSRAGGRPKRNGAPVL
jgi:uncharacterized protein with GYD domain